MTAMQQPSPAASATWHDYWVVTKPRVTALAVFTSFIGMLLVDKGFPPATVVIGGCVGIALLAGASFAMNCLLEAAVDARMKRTDWRPSAQGRLSTAQIVIFAFLLGVVGSAVLITTTNVLTWALTLATFFGSTRSNARQHVAPRTLPAARRRASSRARRSRFPFRNRPK